MFPPCMCCLLKIIVLFFQLVVEAAAMSEEFKQMDPNMKNIGIILCGGNVDIDSLLWYTHG